MEKLHNKIHKFGFNNKYNNIISKFLLIIANKTSYLTRIAGLEGIACCDFGSEESSDFIISIEQLN